MLEHYKDDIARFFQRAARNYNIEFNENDWNNLETRLNLKADRLKIQRSRRLVSLVVVSLVSTGIFFSAKFLLESHQSAKLATSPSNTNDHHRLGQEDSMQKHLTDSAQLKGNSKGQLKHPFVRDSARKTVNSQWPILGLDRIWNSLQNDTATFEHTISDRISRATVTRDTVVKKMDSVCFAEAEPHAADLNKDIEKSKKSPWSLMVSVSPEWSTLGSERISSPGAALGAFAFYRVTNSLSLSLGAVVSDKIYSDEGRNFHPLTPSYWDKKTNGVVPDEVRGSCSMLEIPFGLQIDVIGNRSKSNRTRAYLGANITNYIMFHEAYHYDFSTPNTGAQEGWNSTRSSHYLAGTIGFMAGYERSISDHLSLGISPYIKIPTNGFGTWANVKIFSFGCAANLRYTFHKKRNPN